MLSDTGAINALIDIIYLYELSKKKLTSVKVEGLVRQEVYGIPYYMYLNEEKVDNNPSPHLVYMRPNS